MVILALLCCLSLRTSGTSLIPIQSVADSIDYKYPHYCENSRAKVVICMSKDKKSETSEVIPTIFIVLPFKKKKKLLSIFCFQIIVECTFLDYVMGGCQLNFTVS